MSLPIVLETTPHPGGVTLRVLGNADRHVEARFVLEVRAGSNQSTCSGVARLAPGEAPILSTFTVSTEPTGRWEAALRVSPTPGEPYELRSPAA